MPGYQSTRLNTFRSYLVNRLPFLRRVKDEVQLFSDDLFERSEKDAGIDRADVQMALSDLNWAKISLDRAIDSLTKVYNRIKKDGHTGT